ncbi:hypothetical protein FOA52_006706 [Chlamydomonas sp. UWO 241]|nr:hypothetical protein FOA52_006706 [Chlamydomonas sp. UWO 241]
MSFGYADRLKQKKDVGGSLGSPEYHDELGDVALKMARVATLMSAEGAKTVAFTGAGISTSIGIPDFRGPSGIWTLRAKKQPLPPMKARFEYAVPSFTHMVLVSLLQAGKLTNVCSQNVDSLHMRSGLPRRLIAELHGNCFAERCRTCKREYLRDFEVETVGFKDTGRMCTHPGCGGRLHDNTLDWDSKLPEDELEEAIERADQAAVSLVLGTSLQIAPANELPLITREGGGKFVIVNLQKTPRDRQAHIIARARVDFCMALLMRELKLAVPPYVRTDTAIVAHRVVSGSSGGSGGGGSGSSGAGVWGLRVRVHSAHGEECPMPMVASVALLALLDVDTGLELSHAGGVALAAPAAAEAEAAEAEVGAAGGGASGGVAAAAAEAAKAAAAGGGGTANSASGSGTSGSGVGDGSGNGVGNGSSGSAGRTSGGGAEAEASAGAGHPGGSGAGLAPDPGRLVATGAAPFEFDLSGAAIRRSVRRVSVRLELTLVSWADSDKRTVTLTHVVDACGAVGVGQVACDHAWRAVGQVALSPDEGDGGGLGRIDGGAGVKGESEGGPGEGVQGASKNSAVAGGAAEVKAEGREGGDAKEAGGQQPGRRQQQQQQQQTRTTQQQQQQQQLQPSTTQQQPWVRSVHRFVTQRAQHDGAAIIDAYLADPPPVVKPPVAGGKRKAAAAAGESAGAAAAGGSGSGGAGEAGYAAAVRRSSRAGRATQRGGGGQAQQD